MIDVENLNVTYSDGTNAVKDLNIKIQNGENIALIGSNGAGKTSLIMALVGVVDFDGKIIIDGIRSKKETISKIRQRVGVILQNPDDQLFMPTVYDDIAFGLRNQGFSENDIEAHVFECMEMLGITSLKDKMANHLSGGQKRTVALATVLVMEPDIILMDEPTAFLDHRSRRILIQHLKKIKQTKIIATHDLAFAAEICERTILLKEGIIAADGKSKEILYNDSLMEYCGCESANIYYNKLLNVDSGIEN